jgi:hypothetical protein
VAAFAAGADAHVTAIWPSAQGVAVPVTFTSSTGSSIVTEAAYRFSRLQRRFQAAKSVPVISRRPIRRLYSRSAAITVNWSRPLHRCRVRWRPR